MASLLFKNLFSGSKPENGELTINLNLTIKIEADGTLSVTPTADKPVQHNKEEKVKYEIPDMEISNTLIPFGKNV